MSRVIKLELYQMPEPSRSVQFNTLRLQMKMFGVSFHQSLIHEQQYVNCSSSLLFMCTKPTPFAGNVSTGSDKEKCKRYLISAVTEITLALRFLLDTWRDLIRIEQD